MRRTDEPVKSSQCCPYMRNIKIAALLQPCGEQILIGDKIADGLLSEIHKLLVGFIHSLYVLI